MVKAFLDTVEWEGGAVQNALYVQLDGDPTLYFADIVQPYYLRALRSYGAADKLAGRPLMDWYTLCGEAHLEFGSDYK